MAFTKVVGPGIHTLSNILSHNINSSGIITATKFVGPFDNAIIGGGTTISSDGINVTGIVTATGLDVNGNGDISGNLVLGGDLTVNGTTTTLDTNLIGVDRVEVLTGGANVAVAVTHNGSGDLIRLYDGASQVVTVDDEGNVTLSKNNPTISLSDSNNNPDYQIGNINGVLRFQDTTNNATRLGISTTGNVGINSSAPTSKLDVQGDVQISGITTTGSYFNAPSGYRTANHPVVTYASFNLGTGSYATRLGSTGTSTLRHTQIYAGGSHMATFDGNNTRLGIGKTNPDELLHIASTGTAKFRLTDNRTSISDGSQYGVIQFEQRDSNTPGVSVEVAALMTDTTNGATALQIKTGTPSTITERLRITSGGQVRIGNSNNLALWGQNNRLQVAGTDWNTSGITIACMSNSGSANLVMGNSKASTPGGSGGALTQDNRLAYISFVGDDGTDMNTVGAAIVAELDSNASSNSMPARLSFYTGGNQTRRMRITSDGRVLIGRDSTTSISTNAALTIQNPTNSSATRFNLINSGSSQPESTQIYSQNNDLAFVAGASERLRINSTGMAVFSGGSGNVDQVKIESNSGGTGLYLVNFRGEDAGDSSARLGVGKNNNVLMFTNASGSQISNFAIGNTDSIPLVLSTANTRRIHIRGDGRIIMGTGIPTYTNSIVHVEGSGINVETEYTLEDGTGASPQFSIFGSNSHVRIDMGTLDVAPYAGYIQARFDNDPEQTGSSNSGLEPLMLNPKGGVLGYNITDSDGMNAIGNGLIGTQGGFIMRSGRANSTTVNNASTAIKIFPGEIRSYSGSGGTGEQNQGTKYGGIAWNVLDPHNGSWGTNHNGHHCWMGMSLHSTPAQEKSNWQVQMNNDAGAGTFANIVAIQANPEGYVTTPNQPSFCAIKNSSHYYFTSGQRTTISGWTEKHDTHNDFNPSTGVFTAPIAGTYYFYVSVMQDRDGNGDFQLSVFVNSTMYVNSNDMTSSSSVTFQQTTVPCIVNLAKNDEVTFRGYNQTDTTSYIYKTSYTHCGGYLIG